MPAVYMEEDGAEDKRTTLPYILYAAAACTLWTALEDR
jgi:hypothetical protein